MANFLAAVLALLLNVSSVTSPRFGGSIQVDCTHQAWAFAQAQGNKALGDKYLDCLAEDGAVLVYHFIGTAPVADRVDYDWVDYQH